MERTLHLLDYFIVIITLIGSIGMGMYFARRQDSTKQYFAASGSIPAWAVGISILATLISSVTFLAYPGEGFSSNWIRLVQGLMVPVVLVFMVKFVVPLYRNAIGLSAYEYFEKRFGLFARFYASFAFILAHFSKMGTVFFLIALALSSMMGVNTYVVIYVLGISVIVLTMMGGIEAVIWLDVIQGIMLMAGGLICLMILLFIPEGGPVAVIQYAWSNNKIGLGPYDMDFTKLTFIVMALNGVFYAIQKYGTDQTIIQRYLTSKTDKEAIKAALLGVFLSVPVWALFMFIGTALYAYYDMTIATLPAGIRADAIFPHFIVNELPIGLAGLIVATLLAAAISSLDSDMNCLAAIGVEDYYKRLKPNSTDEEQLRMGKILVVISGIAAILVATLYVQAGSKGVLGVVFALYAIFSGGIAGLFILGLVSKRANKQGLYIGIAASVLFTGYALLTSSPMALFGEKRLLLDLGDYNFTHHKYMLGVYSHVVLFSVAWVASHFFELEAPDDNLTIYGWLESRKQAA
jgi:SSS family solute:Na+ symporter|tara:strand:+ start:1507 stop:3066 length:1560 start_codon:yes stop_codon:yes gene_type:complete